MSRSRRRRPRPAPNEYVPVPSGGDFVGDLAANAAWFGVRALYLRLRYGRRPGVEPMRPTPSIEPDSSGHVRVIDSE